MRPFAVKVSWSFYCFISSISNGVKNCFPRLWGTGISDAIFSMMTLLDLEPGSKVMISFEMLLHLEALEPIINEIQEPLSVMTKLTLKQWLKAKFGTF